MNQFFIFYFVVTIYVELDYDVQNRFKSYQCFIGRHSKQNIKLENLPYQMQWTKFTYNKNRQKESIPTNRHTHTFIYAATARETKLKQTQ